MALGMDKELKVESEEALARKAEANQQKKAGKQKKKRQNNMRAAIMTSRSKANQQGGNGGQIGSPIMGKGRLQVVQASRRATTCAGVSCAIYMLDLIVICGHCTQNRDTLQ